MGAGRWPLQIRDSDRSSDLYEIGDDDTPEEAKLWQLRMFAVGAVFVKLWLSIAPCVARLNSQVLEV